MAANGWASPNYTCKSISYSTNSKGRDRAMNQHVGGVLLEQTLCRMDAAAERTRTCLQRVCGSNAPPACAVHCPSSSTIQKGVQ